ncbi:MAG: hypothetical protein QW334_00420 [Thermofilum sp.]
MPPYSIDKEGKTTEKESRLRTDGLQITREDWRGIIALALILSFTIVFIIALVLRVEKDVILTITTVYGSAISGVVSSYFAAKAGEGRK